MKGLLERVADVHVISSHPMLPHCVKCCPFFSFSLFLIFLNCYLINDIGLTAAESEKWEVDRWGEKVGVRPALAGWGLYPFACNIGRWDCVGRTAPSGIGGRSYRHAKFMKSPLGVLLAK